MVQLLICQGANVNAKGGGYGNALQAASRNGHEAVVQLLLDRGADVYAQGGTYGNALQAASLHGKKAMVQLLLNMGAVVNAQGGGYGTALQAASRVGHETVVKLLLDQGANVNAQGGPDGTALKAALMFGHEAVVQLLLVNATKPWKVMGGVVNIAHLKLLHKAYSTGTMKVVVIYFNHLLSWFSTCSDCNEIRIISPLTNRGSQSSGFRMVLQSEVLSTVLKIDLDQNFDRTDQNRPRILTDPF
ncbi:ankyrin repeat-containing domain protein [Mycena rebaudengoi]|nr:ankyrin repeat-containing domain protein [Mycena rebaudengoi]